jgi:hypothetical protein
MVAEKCLAKKKGSITNENVSTDNKDSAIEELGNEKLKKVDMRKKARLRTRGPHRKADI